MWRKRRQRKLNLGGRMIVRFATMADLDQVLKLTQAFYAGTEGKVGVDLDEKSVMERVRDEIENHIGFVLENDGDIVGMFGGYLTSMYANKHIKVFMETTWYVKPAHRGHSFELLRDAEKLLISMNIDKMIIGQWNIGERERFEKVYARKGFELFEQHYIKELKHENSERHSKTV